MKRIISILCLALVLTGVVCAQPAAPVEDTAGKAFDELQTVARSVVTLLNDPAVRKMPRSELEGVFAASSELTVALGEKFLRDFPQDGRRWDVIATMLSSRRNFSGPDADARKTAWQARSHELFQLVAKDASVPAEAVAKVAGSALYSGLSANNPSADLGRAGAAIELLATRASAAPGRPMAERSYLEALHTSDPAAALARARTLVAGSNVDVAETARLWLHSVEFKSKPLDLKFPDLDGREIDLAQYRGKVVLLDFWATWCVPCMEQMPHLVETYRKYHAKGFEVIGVTDDIPPRDPANPRRVEKTVPMLKEFLAQHGMAWPQLWDTRTRTAPGPKGLLQQFGVRSLPTYLLFDRNGMFVTSDLKGEKLDRELERLLGP